MYGTVLFLHRLFVSLVMKRHETGAATFIGISFKTIKFSIIDRSSKDIKQSKMKVVDIGDAIV